jgi:hypothetical protein
LSRILSEQQIWPSSAGAAFPTLRPSPEKLFP